jgi:hypothetical protein
MYRTTQQISCLLPGSSVLPDLHIEDSEEVNEQDVGGKGCKEIGNRRRGCGTCAVEEQDEKG